jgi:hypothetical protein
LGNSEMAGVRFVCSLPRCPPSITGILWQQGDKSLQVSSHVSTLVHDLLSELGEVGVQALNVSEGQLRDPMSGRLWTHDSKRTVAKGSAMHTLSLIAYSHVRETSSSVNLNLTRKLADLHGKQCQLSVAFDGSARKRLACSIMNATALWL